MTELSNFFDAMSNCDRRRILFTLLDRDDQREICVHQNSDVVTESEVETPLVRLNHVDLPKLADYGYVEWGRDTDTVSRGPKFDEIRPLLAALLEQRDESLDQ